MYKIFIGYDQKEAVSFHALSHSLLRHAEVPISITPITQNSLTRIYSRPSDPRQSNSFSFTRFLVPYLCNYEGCALYMDCDMLVTENIGGLFDELKAKDEAVHVVKHEYKSKMSTKYLGNKNYHYPRKNWSSFVFWNCGATANSAITPDLVSSAEPAFLHRFQWLKDEDIGELGTEWNFLVGEYDKKDVVPKNIHWTLGGPYFNEFSNADYAEMWNEEYRLMINCEQLNSPKKND